jgi:hypothetical protein
VSLTPSTGAWMSEAWAPLVEEIDALVSDLSDDERVAVHQFLEDAVDAAERDAARIGRDAHEAARDALAVALPTLSA